MILHNLLLLNRYSHQDLNKSVSALYNLLDNCTCSRQGRMYHPGNKRKQTSLRKALLGKRLRYLVERN
jgi:hypothetical protein